jgi:hypothetical protein
MGAKTMKNRDRDFGNRIHRAWQLAKRNRAIWEQCNSSMDTKIGNRAYVLLDRATKVENLIMRLAAEALEVHSEMAV